jgi:hypothetical protein
VEDANDDVDYDEERQLYAMGEEDSERPFYWSVALQQSFREELEKYVYCMVRDLGLTLHRLVILGMLSHG